MCYINIARWPKLPGRRQRVCPNSISAKRSQLRKKNCFRRQPSRQRRPRPATIRVLSRPACNSVARPGRIFSLLPSLRLADSFARFTFLMAASFCGQPPPGRMSFFIRARFRPIRSTSAHSRIRSINLLTTNPDRPRQTKQKLLWKKMSLRWIFLSRQQLSPPAIRR